MDDMQLPLSTTPMQTLIPTHALSLALDIDPWYRLFEMTIESDHQHWWLVEISGNQLWITPNTHTVKDCNSSYRRYRCQNNEKAYVISAILAMFGWIQLKLSEESSLVLQTTGQLIASNSCITYIKSTYPIQ